MTDIEILMASGSTKAEAERHLKRGSAVYDLDSYVSEIAAYADGLADDGESEADVVSRYLADCRSGKGHIHDHGYVKEADGTEHFIMYVL